MIPRLDILVDALFDGERLSRGPRRIRVVDGRIERVVPLATELEPCERVIDAQDALVLPGLINTHVHIARGGLFEPAEPPMPAQVARHFRGALDAGVTTVADLGCTAGLIASLRRHVRQTPLAGPEIVASGPLLTAPQGYPLDWMAPWLARLGAALTCGSERDACLAVQRVADAGMDHVKLAIMHRSYADQPLPAVTVPTASAIVAEAHHLGLRVFAHAHRNADYQVALAAGVDVLAHSSFDPLGDELVARMRDAGVAVCPTLWVFESVCLLEDLRLEREPSYLNHAGRRLGRSLRHFAEAYRAADGVMPEGIAAGLPKAAARQAVRTASANLRLLDEAKVPIIFGNDSAYGFALPSRPGDELAAMQRAGLDTETCLRAATSGAAAALALKDRGRLAPGQRADLVAVDPRAVEDLTRLEDVRHVVVGGRELRRDESSDARHTLALSVTYARGLRETVRAALMRRSNRPSWMSGRHEGQYGPWR